MAKIQYSKDVKNDASKAQVDVTIVVKPEEYARVWEMAADRLSKTVSMPGFRKGKVPVASIKGAYANQINENAFNDMVNTIVTEVVEEAEIKPLSTVRINVLEHEHNENEPHDHNIEFVISYAYRVNPKLPDLEKISVERPNIEVTDAEIKESLEMLMNSINSSPKKDGEEREEIKEWNDENIHLLNIPDVKTVEDLKNLVKSEIEKQKNYENEIQYRSAILDEIIKNSEITIPSMILEDMIAQQELDYRSRIAKLGFDYDQYIKDKNINIEDLKKEWETLIKTDLSRELILSQYAQDANVEVADGEIDVAVQNADQELKDRYTPEGLRQYMKYIILNNKAFGKIYAIVSKEEQA